MNFIRQILIGMIIFNSMLFAFGIFFTNTTFSADDNAVNTTQSLSEYDINSMDITDLFGILTNNVDLLSAAVGGISIAIGFAVAVSTKNYIILAASLFVGIVLALFSQTFAVITSLNMTNNTIISTIFAIIMVAIGILIIFEIVNIFGGKIDAT